MKGIRILTKIAGGLAASGAAVACALSSPVTASAVLNSVDVNQLPFVEFSNVGGIIAHANGNCQDHCSATITWGDGAITTIDRTANDISASHLYFEEGPYPVSVSVTSWGCFIACVGASTVNGAAVGPSRA